MSDLKCTLILLAHLTMVGAHVSRAQEPTSAEFFENRIRPVLVKHCYECHSAASQSIKGGLRVDWEGGLIAGGDSGASVVPGNPENSLLLSALRYDGLEMPPTGQLPKETIDDLERWIQHGAIDPRKQEPSNAPQDRDPTPNSPLWSFQAIKTPPSVPVTHSNWCESEIDHFIVSKQQAQKLAPIDDIDPPSLLRRMAYDLTGLPPTLADIHELQQSANGFDFEAYADRLIGSKQFGEHWGRRWLDVARYADSNGGDFNATFHDAWRFRNYVVDAYNSDMPLQQFIVEQIAGDLLAYDTSDERHRQLVATGFLMLGAKMLSERDKTKLQMDVVDEQISAVGTAFLGLTLGCARCHDHKFDPIPTADYYALAGIFKSTHSLEGEIQKYVSNWKRIPLPIATEHDAALKKHAIKVESVKLAISEAEKLVPQASKKVATNNPGQQPAPPKPSATKADASPETNTSPEVRAAQTRLDELKEELKNLQKQAPIPAPTALAAEDAEHIGDCAICIRGEPNLRGSIVPRGFLMRLDYEVNEPIPADESGRLQLARWIANENNPLTARVYVNRIWAHLMGVGIVASVDNFGQLGVPPSHPELLDYLATEFTRRGWSTKWLAKEIVSSHVYRLSSRTDATCDSIDPENRYLWRANRRRLSAESIRDTLLLASEQLDASVPESPVSELGTLVTQNNANDGGYAQRATAIRTLYMPIVRNELPSLMRVFDFADPDIGEGDRPETTVPEQALWMLNSPFARNSAEQVAKRVLLQSSAPAQRIQLLYIYTLGRPPTPVEQELALNFINELPPDAAPPLIETGWSDLVQAVLASTSFRMID